RSTECSLIVTFGDPAIGSHNFLVTDDGEQGTQHNQAAGHQGMPTFIIAARLDNDSRAWQRAGLAGGVWRNRWPSASGSMVRAARCLPSRIRHYSTSCATISCSTGLNSAVGSPNAAHAPC